VPDDLEEAEVAAGGVHLGGDRPLPLRTPLAERRKIDDGNRAGGCGSHAHHRRSRYMIIQAMTAVAVRRRLAGIPPGD
jgi:hypothetical protein